MSEAGEVMENVRYYCFSSLVMPKNRSHVVDRAPLVLGSAHLSLAVDGVSGDYGVGKSLKIPASSKPWSGFNRTHPRLLNNCSVFKDLQPPW